MQYVGNLSNLVCFIAAPIGLAVQEVSPKKLESSIIINRLHRHLQKNEGGKAFYTVTLRPKTGFNSRCGVLVKLIYSPP